MITELALCIPPQTFLIFSILGIGYIVVGNSNLLSLEKHISVTNLRIILYNSELSRINTSLLLATTDDNNRVNCDVCGKPFYSRKRLEQHTEGTHSLAVM